MPDFDPYGAGAPIPQEPAAPSPEQRLLDERTFIGDLARQVLQLRERFTRLALSGNVHGINVHVYRQLLKRYEDESALRAEEFPDEPYFKSCYKQAVDLKNLNEF